jgi:hypothetical protein
MRHRHRRRCALLPLTGHLPQQQARHTQLSAAAAAAAAEASYALLWDWLHLQTYSLLLSGYLLVPCCEQGGEHNLHN